MVGSRFYTSLLGNRSRKHGRFVTFVHVDNATAGSSFLFGFIVSPRNILDQVGQRIVQGVLVFDFIKDIFTIKTSNVLGKPR